MFTELEMCPIMSLKRTKLEPINGGLKELEIILHEFQNYGHSIGYPSCVSKAVIYSCNGNRNIHDIFVEDDLTRTQTVKSKLTAEELIDSLSQLDCRNPWRRNKAVRRFQSESVDAYPSIRFGYCTIHDVLSGPKKQNETTHPSGKIVLNTDVDIDIVLDFNPLRARLKELYLERPFIVFLKIKLHNPIKCYSDNNGNIYIKTPRLSMDGDFEGNKKLISNLSDFTFDYAVLDHKYEIDRNQYSGKAVFGLNISNYEWDGGDLVLCNPIEEKTDDANTPF